MTSAISRLASHFREQLRVVSDAELVSLFLDVDPKPASRPRVTRFNGVYYGAPYKRFYDAAKLRLEDLAGDRQPTDAALILLAEFLAEKPKTGKLDYPRGDTDNFCKGPLDAMTKVARFWRDDNQLVGLLAFKRYAALGEKPGVQIDYAPVP